MCAWAARGGLVRAEAARGEGMLWAGAGAARVRSPPPPLPCSVPFLGAGELWLARPSRCPCLRVPPGLQCWALTAHRRARAGSAGLQRWAPQGASHPASQSPLPPYHTRLLPHACTHVCVHSRANPTQAEVSSLRAEQGMLSAEKGTLEGRVAVMASQLGAGQAGLGSAQQELSQLQVRALCWNRLVGRPRAEQCRHQLLRLLCMCAGRRCAALGGCPHG